MTVMTLSQMAAQQDERSQPWNQAIMRTKKSGLQQIKSAVDSPSQDTDRQEGKLQSRSVLLGHDTHGH